ncbi:MAG: hypothetical protein LBP26_01925 [Clostridiales bacterium]|jgi:hypothetical protein|nr:hypothetical protein [Clostridiales bacterium]
MELWVIWLIVFAGVCALAFFALFAIFLVMRRKNPDKFKIDYRPLGITALKFLPLWAFLTGICVCMAIVLHNGVIFGIVYPITIYFLLVARTAYLKSKNGGAPPPAPPEQTVLNYNMFFGLTFAVGCALCVLLGVTVYGIAALVSAAAACAFLNCKRLFTTDIERLSKGKTYAVDTLCFTAGLLCAFFSTDGSILNIADAVSGETFLSIRLFPLIFSFLALIPYHFSSRKIAKDPKIRAFVRNKLDGLTNKKS